jgi:hypothetical protein
MRKLWIIGVLIVLAAIGLILGLSGYDVLSAGDFTMGYFSAGRFSTGVFSAGIFSVGIFSVGIFSVGIFSLGIFNIALFATGFFMLAWKKCYGKTRLVPEEETQE